MDFELTKKSSVVSLKDVVDDDTGLVVVWQGVAGYYDQAKLKYESERNERNKRNDEQPHVKYSNAPIQQSLKDESFLKLIARSTASITKPQLNIVYKPKQNTGVFKEETIFIPNTIVKSTSFRYIPDFKNILNKVLRKIKPFRETGSDEDEMESFDIDSDYHNLSLADRNSSVVTSLASQFTFKPERGLSRDNTICRHLRKLLPDMRDALSAEKLLNMFVDDFHLQIPFQDEDLENKDIYEAAIKKNKVIYKMLTNNINMMPSGIASLLYKNKKPGSDLQIERRFDDSQKDLYFYTSLAKTFNNILEEISEEMKDVRMFYYPLFKFAFEMVQPIDYLLEFEDETLLKREVSMLNNELKSNRNTPGSLVRWKVMEFLRSSETNHMLTTILVNSCQSWLNNLLKCLFSEYSSVREEACLALAYLMTRQTVTNELFNLRHYDISYDILATIFRAIELFPVNISCLYCSIGYIMNRSFNVALLELIADKGPALTNRFVKRNWPKLLYYALKYWPYSLMVENPATLRKIKDVLQIMVLIKETKKSAKMAMCFLSRKFLLKTKVSTVWFEIDLVNGKVVSAHSNNKEA